MKPLTLTLKQRPPCSLDASPLTPAAFVGKSLDDIRRMSLIGWNATFSVGDLFALKGDDHQHIVFEDLDGSLFRIGANLTEGRIDAHGDCNDYLGESMRGGTLVAHGKAGTHVGSGMRKGTLEIKGDAGAFAGSGRAGEMQGMSGGMIVVRGKAGDRLGDRMRRGTIIVEGGVGNYCASRMLAGTIIALGPVAAHPGYLMRRGTLVFDDTDAPILPTFNDNGVQDLLAIRLLLLSLSKHSRAVDRIASRVRTMRRWLGDLGADGKGEILIA